MSDTTEKATFAAGCFWGVEAAFREVPGVVDAIVGYTGGKTDNPTYMEVCSHVTGHAEAVEVTFDPDEVTFDDLLDLFWAIHDPTQLNRQGPDVGDQYRSAIFVHSDEQKTAAEASRKQAQESQRKPIVTHIETAPRFWKAEDYHQQYFAKRGIAGGCHLPNQ